jgi:hypothetical protein
MCPDIVETRLLNQREREWKPDPQVINKWTVLYNLQKDYMNRMLPQIDAMKNYDDIMHQKILKEKAEKQNLANLIQFQNKVNFDLKKDNGNGNNSFDSNGENCDDDNLKYQHTKTIAPRKSSETAESSEIANHLGNFNKMLFNKIKSNNLNLHEGFSKTNLDKNNKSILQQAMKNFFNKNGQNKNGFNFAEKETKIESDDENALSDDKMISPEPKYINEKMVESSINFDKMLSNIKLANGEQVEYLGTSVGSPYLPEKDFKNKLEKMKVEVGKPVSNKSENQIKKILKSEEGNDEKKAEPVFISKKETIKSIKTNEKVEKKKKLKSNVNKPKIKISSPPQKVESKVDKETSKSADPIIDSDSDPFTQIDQSITNPPPLSFIETSDNVRLDTNLYDALQKSQNFNLETQRRGRRRSRFPDPQWDCAETQIAKLVRYLCEEEVSASYQKYCKPVFEQINTMIESFLYHDNNLEICQNLHMCPVTVDI